MIVTFERDIRSKLKELEGKVIKSLEESFNKNENVKPAFTKVLSIIAEILYDTAIKHDEWHGTINGNSHDFSFFPGYISNKGDRIFNILFIKFNEDGTFEISSKRRDGFEKFNLDFWYNEINHSNDNNNKYKSISVLSLAYHFLFLGKSEKIKTPLFFSPEVGGTHQWASSVSDEIALSDKLNSLELLAFYHKKKDARLNQISNDSWINIPFEFKTTENSEIKDIHEEIYEWCESVINKLDYPSNRKEIDRIKYKWPYNPIDLKKIKHTDKKLRQKEIDKLNEDYNYSKKWLLYRAYIVGFWMMFVLSIEKLFCFETNELKNNNLTKAWFTFTDYYITITKPGRTSIKDKSLMFRKSRLDYFHKILTNKRNLENKKIHFGNYKYWYTIPFQHRLDFSPENKEENNRTETGSVMILTNFLLDREYFRFTTPWVKQMYNAMREYDTSLITALNINKKNDLVMKEVGLDEETRNKINSAHNFKIEPENE